LFFGFEGLFGLFLFLFGFGEVFDEIFVVSAYFFGLIFLYVHLSLDFDDFVGVVFGFFIHLPADFFVVLDLLMVLLVHLL
jgi:hypothetical protein